MQGKPENLLSSYHPINNLVSIEKIIKHYLRENLEEYMESNNILHHEHHGSRRHHSTMTALTRIHNEIYKNYENGCCTAVMTTDLTAAYDTVDHEILISKLNYYGIEGIELELFKSYLKDRSQYMMLDTFPSEIIQSMPCSVCQGSKLSGLFYSIYVNELPNLYKLMNTKSYEEITGKKVKIYKDINHVTINYVDDSTNVVSFKNVYDMNDYLSSYYNLLECYYGANMLKINPDKTKFLVICKESLRNRTNNIKFKAGNYIIKQEACIKILGTWLQNNRNLDRQINYIVSKASNRLHQIGELNRYTTFKSRLDLTNSIVMGILCYVLPLYYNCKISQLQKLHKLQIHACRMVIGNNCFKISNVKVLARCKWLSIVNLIRYRVLVFLHKIKIMNKTKSIINLFTSNKSNRIITPKTFPIYKPKSKKLYYFLIYKGNYINNKIPNYITQCKLNVFKKSLKQYLQSNFHPFKLHTKYNYNANSSDSSEYLTDSSES